MSVRSSGIWCDVCNTPKPLELCIVMTITGVSPNIMHCCDNCKPSMEKWNKYRDINLVPEGPLKNIFKKAMISNNEKV